MFEEPKSKLGKLYHKFQNSGIGGNPIITDNELTELFEGMLQMVFFMEDTGNRAMHHYFQLEMNRIDDVIRARLP